MTSPLCMLIRFRLERPLPQLNIQSISTTPNATILASLHLVAWASTLAAHILGNSLLCIPGCKSPRFDGNNT